ncbi:hypothetical protein HJFPF1_12520 [Paramyrothecium foliicola]|nr:hypothetical protein HJFPF1_12520 [Paramyrothecium foliicola]
MTLQHQAEPHHAAAKARRLLRKKEYKHLTASKEGREVVQDTCVRRQTAGRRLCRSRCSFRYRYIVACYEPIKYHSFRDVDRGHLESLAETTARDAQFRDLFCHNCHNNAGLISGWVAHVFVRMNKIQEFRQSWESPHDGKPEAHVFH